MAAARGAVPALRQDVAELVAVRRHPALELAPEVLAAPEFTGGHLGLVLADEVDQLVDVEAGNVDGCPGGTSSWWVAAKTQGRLRVADCKSRENKEADERPFRGGG